MMSHYGVPYELEEDWSSTCMELSIETLTGTAFNITVSRDDTIMSVKSEIQRVEGIPVSQQHLLYNLEELDNSASVQDYALEHGARLQLVLSMRVGPINTKRLPPVDEIAWIELQELMSETHRDDLFDRLPSGSKVTVLIVRDGEQVNLLRVVENKDGSFSPLPESGNRTIRNPFAREDPEESAKRLQENSVTMGKVQELKEKLETLSIQRKEKRIEDSTEGNSRLSHEVDENREMTRKCNLVSYPSDDLTKPVWKPENESDNPEMFRPRRRLASCSKVSMRGLSKARKEAKNIIRMQSKLGLLVESDGAQSYRFKRPPLPEIRRSPPSDSEDAKTIQDDNNLGKNMREKTARSIAIVEEESDFAPAPSICSSPSSILALPSSDEVAAAIVFSPISRERVSTTVNRSLYKVSRSVVESDERPKTSPEKGSGREGKREQYCGLVAAESDSSSSKRTNHILSTISNILPRGMTESEESGSKRHEPIIRNPSLKEELSKPQKLSPPLVKKRLRCSQCRKKLNITNTYNCRCGGLFCAIHRYSEVHNCVFDYKQEGRKLLQQMNPLIGASKLPKI